jgi:hypothetical protein
LTTVDAEADYSFEEPGEIPSEAVKGAAKVVAHGDDGPVEREFLIL